MSDSVLVNGEPIGGGGGVVSIVGSATFSIDEGEIKVVETGVADADIDGEALFPVVGLSTEPVESTPKFEWTTDAVGGDTVQTELVWNSFRGEWEVGVSNETRSSLDLRVIVIKVPAADDSLPVRDPGL